MFVIAQLWKLYQIYKVSVKTYKSWDMSSKSLWQLKSWHTSDETPIVELFYELLEKSVNILRNLVAALPDLPDLNYISHSVEVPNLLYIEVTLCKSNSPCVGLLLHSQMSILLPYFCLYEGFFGALIVIEWQRRGTILMQCANWFMLEIWDSHLSNTVIAVVKIFIELRHAIKRILV